MNHLACYHQACRRQDDFRRDFLSRGFHYSPVGDCCRYLDACCRECCGQRMLMSCGQREEMLNSCGRFAVLMQGGQRVVMMTMSGQHAVMKMMNCGQHLVSMERNAEPMYFDVLHHRENLTLQVDGLVPMSAKPMQKLLLQQSCMIMRLKLFFS